MVRDRLSAVVGRYELVRELGHGGTATVHLARQTDLDRLVALKELSAPAVSDPSIGHRFVLESRVAGSLNHPNIVTVHDFFEHDGTGYIAMEYLRHGSLRPLLGKRLPCAQLAGVLEGLLAGLEHAHENGIVHRDIKPENLMISAGGRVKIADFGIAKVVDQARTETAARTTIGTPAYMAPEQAMGGNIGPWTDMYAVGVIAFELLTGRTPFDATGTPAAILRRHVKDAPARLASVVPTADPRLCRWIDRLLVKEPEQRQHSAGSAWHELEEVVLDRLGPRWRRGMALPRATSAVPARYRPIAGDRSSRSRERHGFLPGRASSRTIGALLRLDSRIPMDFRFLSIAAAWAAALAIAAV